MNKKPKKFVFMVLGRSVLIAILVALLLFIPTISVFTNDETLSKNFFGNKAEYEGIITLWNVDTFEGGSSSRSSFLNNVAMKFEKQNKGAYIKVENLTVDEMVANINAGKIPNMFSFGTGVSGYLKEHMSVLKTSIGAKLKSNFYSAGLDGGNLKAVAWCYSVYSLISTTEKIENSGKEYNGSLKELAFSMAYDKNYKKKSKHIYSLTFGKNDFVSALDIFSREFTLVSVVDEAEKGNVDNKYNTQTPYEAYLNFITSKSSMLLGTARDVFRMENRLMTGQEVDVLYEPLGVYTDLVSYISVLNADERIMKVCKSFVEFLISDNIQKRLTDIGLMSPVLNNLYDSGVMKKLEESVNENTIIKNIF